jgi:hypothetical protein
MCFLVAPFIYWYFGPRVCSISRLGVQFLCSRGTVIQYWPNIFENEFVLVNPSTAIIDEYQNSDENMYKTGVVISRYHLLDDQLSIKTARDLVEYELLQQTMVEKNGQPPVVPGSGKLLLNVSPSLSQWDGVVVQEIVGGGNVYINVKDGYVYKLQVNQGKSFSDLELNQILSSFRWSIKNERKE